MQTDTHTADVGANHGSKWISPILAVTATAFAAAMWWLGWLPAVDRISGDLLLRSTPTRHARAAPVAAILIDDASVEAYGPLPWPRDRLARVADAARVAGADALAVDLILAERGSPDGDASLAKVLAAGPVALAAAIDSHGAWLLPLDAFGGGDVAAHAYGEVGPDGVVRTFSATKQADGMSLPALSLAAARLLRPDIPIVPGAELRPDFQPPPQNVMAFSAVDALETALPAAELAGRLVFIGISATGTGDQFVVPTGPGHTPVPGVLAHASASASILDGRLLRLLGPVWSGVAALALAFGVQLLRDRRGAFDLFRFSLLAAGVGAVAIISLHGGLVLVPVAALIVTMVVSALLRETVESRLTHRQSGRLLHSILAHSGVHPSGPVPRTSRARLEAIRQLQQRVLAEDATRRALLAGMTEGVVLWDAAGDVLVANPAARRLWGGVPEVEDIVGEGSSKAGIPIQLRRGPFELSVAVTRLESNRLAIIRDVTAELTLERKRRDMQRLVSHELKTPLASIAAFGETLERYKLSGEELSRVAAMIRGEAVRLQDMVTVFLDLERLGAGHWDGEASAVDLGSLVRSRLEVLEAAAAASGLSIEASVENGCRTTGVPALLDRVVDNLVGNAVKYSDAGDRIEVEVRREANRIFVTVRDHGPGIPGDSLEHIFDRFYRVPGTKSPGAGLGLSLVKDIVDWHGGCISIDTEPGVGSTFTIGLPALEED